MVSTETQKRIDELKAQIAEIEATAHREDLNKAVKKQVSDDELYPLAKAFTNYVERQRKVKNLEDARAKKAEKQEAGAPVAQ